MAKKKYKRTIFFDIEQKKWISYYTNKNLKIVIDKKSKTLKQIKKYFKKDEFKKVKKDKGRAYKGIITTSKEQNKLDRLLRKKKKLNNKQLEEIEKISENYSYRKKAVEEKLKFYNRYKPAKGKKFEYLIDTIINKQTSSFFRTNIKEFKLFKEAFIRQNMNKFKSYLIRLEFDNFVFENITNKRFYLNIRNFTDTMKEILDINLQKLTMEWTRKRIKIIVKGIRK